MYLPYFNGVVHSIQVARKFLEDRGHSVYIFTPRRADLVKGDPHAFCYPSLRVKSLAEGYVGLPFSPAIERDLPGLQLDIIHSNHPILMGHAAMRLAQRLSLPLIFTFHSQYIYYGMYFPVPLPAFQQWARRTIKKRLRHYASRCNRVIAPTQSMADLLLEYFDICDQVSIVPSGVDLACMKPADRDGLRQNMGWQDDYLLISCGRLGYEKNWTTLFQAAALAWQNDPRIRLAMIGDGPDRDRLAALADSLGFAHRVTFLGEIPHSTVIDYLQCADLFVFSSLAETQGLATIEAMAAGLPIAAVDAPGTRDLVQNGVQGLLTPDVPSSLAEVILHIMHTPALAERLSRAGRLRAGAFDVNQTLPALLEAYTRAIEDHRAGKYVRVSNSRTKITTLVQ